MPTCYVALGGNLGPVDQTFQRALDALAATPGVTVGPRSPLHETAPVGIHAGEAFQNAAVEIVTALPPLALLDRLQAIEASLGRVRGEHWSPRTLDLDLILYGDEVIATDRLTVPHPAAWYRRFVLDPLVEIAADVVHPVKQATISTLRDRLLVPSLSLAVAGASSSKRGELINHLRAEFPSVEFLQWPTATEPTFIAWLGDDPNDKSSVTFESLPLLPRLDVTESTQPPLQFLRGVLRAALGT